MSRNSPDQGEKLTVPGSSRRNEPERWTRPEALRPVMRPQPPKLSQHSRELAEIEARGIYSNYGPVNARLEKDLVAAFFGTGECLTVCNATIGLMLAIREVIGEDRPPARRYALMPSFTFAATAQAALWCGLTPLFCDIDAETWLPDEESEKALLQKYAGEIAVVVPYATFGNNLDLVRYERLAETYNVPIVVDAAASLGSLDLQGRAFGSGFRWPLVFSMHATKPFSVGEGGVIYCGDQARIARLRSMGSFGFEQSRSATSIGLNSKLTEVAALTAQLQMQGFETSVRKRIAISKCYMNEFSEAFGMQKMVGCRQVQAFASILLPRPLAASREEILRQLAAKGIGTATYFSPHLAIQTYFQKHAVAGPLPVTEDITERIVSLPLDPEMRFQDVRAIAVAVKEVTDRAMPSLRFSREDTWELPDSLGMSLALAAQVPRRSLRPEADATLLPIHAR